MPIKINCPIKFYTIPYPTYTIGESALGGKIAYILQPGDTGYDANQQHGLVATVNDISSNSIWGCSGTFITNANGTAIGTGLINTNSIVSECNENGAAKQCYDLVEGGYSDWYLPSREELNKLYINRNAIGNFTINSYISSTQSDFANFAYMQDFNDGIQNLFPKAAAASYVRPIRSY